jgi:uncharacterized membrane protein
MRQTAHNLRRILRKIQINPWIIPLIYATVALLFGFTVPRLASVVLPGFVSTVTVSAAIGIYSSIASGMLALTGIVFSLMLLSVQFSASAYSARLVFWIARDRVLSHAIGVFTATFLYALAALAWVDRGGTGRVPFIGLGVVVVLLIASVIMFISLIQRVTMLQVTRMLIFTGEQGRDSIEQLYPPIDTLATHGSAENCQATCVQTLFHHGPPLVVQWVDIPALTHIASETSSVIEMAAAVGDAVLESTPILRLLGGTGPLPEEALRGAIELGTARTFEQDPKYAIRLLVDIAIKALSPAINDPTTAVQALDQIEDLLIRLGRRRLEIGAYHDVEGKLRLLVLYPSWEDFVRLAFDEIRFYGASSIQVMRRMKALFSELIEVLPEERRAAIRYWQERLQSTVARTFSDQEDRTDASSADRQGLGSPQRKADSH